MKRGKGKELEIPLWTLDGTIGVLALFIYNFLLYLLATLGISGIVKDMEQTMGYFGLNSFIDMGLTASQMLTGMGFIFLLSFLLGVGMGHMIRKKEKYKGKAYFINL